MTSEVQRDRAQAFRQLHQRGRILVLPNAWDAASARIFELEGFPAIGTTSAGMAWSLGFPDGERLPLALLVQGVRRIVEAVEVPVSVDIERGYGEGPEEVREALRLVIEAGAVGINIEDGVSGGSGKLAEPDVLVRRISAIRRLATEMDVSLFINARTDVYFVPGMDAGSRLEEAARRLALYTGAGADGLFVPGLTRPEEIARLVQGCDRPLNLYAGPGVPAAKELEELGVARVSVGCGPMQASLALTRRIARELLQAGTYTAFTEDSLSYSDANGMFGAAAGRRRGEEMEGAVLIQRYYEAWSKGDVAALEDLCSPDFVGHDPATGPDFDLEGLKQRLAMFRQTIPDFRVTSEDVIAWGDRVAVRWRTDTTIAGELFGFPPAGRRASWTGITIYRLSGSRIAELWNEWDNLRMLTAVGAGSSSPHFSISKP